MTGCTVILPREEEPVLLGAAIAGAVGAKDFDNIVDAMQAMSKSGKIVTPTADETERAYHASKYTIFEDMYTQQVSYRGTMDKVLRT